MADEDDVVQNISLEGVDEAAKQFEELGDKGEGAFNKISDATKKANDALQGLSSGGAAVDAVKSSIDSVGSSAKEAADKLKRIEDSAKSMGGAMRSAAGAVLGFVGRLSALAGAAAGGLVALGQITKRGEDAKNLTENLSDAMAMQAKASNLATRQTLQADTANISYNRSQRDLNHQLDLGKISLTDYNKAIKELAFKRKEDLKDQIDLNIAQEEAEKKQQKLQRAAEEQRKEFQLQAQALKEYKEKVEELGQPLTDTMIDLGKVLQEVKEDFRDTFGPVAAELLGGLVTSFKEGKEQISEVFEEIADAISDSLDAEDVSSFAESVVGVLKQVAQFIINVLIPTFNGIVKAAQVAADGINAVFGTKFTGGGLLAVAVLAQVTGGLNLLVKSAAAAVAAIRLIGLAFGPWGLLITAVVIALGYLATKVDWPALANTIVSAISSIIDWFKKLPDEAGQSLASAWQSIKDAASSVVDGIKQAWNGFIEYLASWGNSVVEALSAVWQAIVDAVGQVVQAIADAWNGLVEAVTQTWNSIQQGATDAFNAAAQAAQPLIDAIKAVIDWAKRAATALGLINGEGAGADGGGGFARGGPVFGPGTGTSDSIMARLSNGEYVVRAQAVRRYGLRTLSLLNSMQLPLDAVRGFAAGGLVELQGAFSGLGGALPRFAAGGLAEGGLEAVGGRPVVLNIGGESFNLFARENDTAERLGRYANKRRVASAGQKPSYFGGR